MASKELFLISRSKSLTTSKNDTQYSNLNLNGTQKCLIDSGLSSKSILNKNERKITDFIDSKKHHFNNGKSWKTDTWNSKTSKTLALFDSDEEDEGKRNQWKKGSSLNAKKSSTLSLHIAAYEKSIDDSKVEGVDEHHLSSMKMGTFKKAWKSAKNCLLDDAKASFEIPRQQEDQSSSEPEIMQFKASQKLLNLHEIRKSRRAAAAQAESLIESESRVMAGAEQTSSANNVVVGIEPAFATNGMSLDKCDPEPLIKNLWGHLVGYLEEQPPPVYLAKPLLNILREALAILQSEPTVIDLQGIVTIIGGVHGHGDSLMYHMSYSGLPPIARYLFLGNYVGEGFAPHECLFLLLALKVKFPKHIYLLKGCFEDPDVLKGHDFIGGLQKRGLMDDPLVWCFIEQIMHSFPLAALLNNSYFCISGGIGPEMMKAGIPGIRSIQRPPTLTSHISITIECQWACLKLPGDSEAQTDGSPMFTEEMVTKFCGENKLRMIIRSRQLVADGILNFPEQMITLWTPVSFLDSFRNASVSLRLNGENHKASIMRYQTHDKEPESLDDTKPPLGRNAMVL